MRGPHELAMLYIYKITLFFLLVKGSDEYLTINTNERFNLDIEALIILLVELTGKTCSLSLFLGDFFAILVENGLGDEIVVDNRTTQIVVTLMDLEVGIAAFDPFTPRHWLRFSRQIAILTLFLDSGQIFVLATQTTLESGFLQDFGLSLTNLHGSDSLEGCDGSAHCQQVSDLLGQSGGDGDCIVAHAYEYNDFPRMSTGVYFDTKR